MLETDKPVPRDHSRLWLRFEHDLLFFLIASMVFVLDQFTKYLVRANLALGESFPHTGILRISHVTNTGAAFGILQGQTVFLAFTTLFGLAAILFYYLYPPMEHGILRVALGLQLGGALGNLSDRIRVGHVTDFIDFRYWPSFNVADSCIVIGVLAIVAFLTFGDRLWPTKEDDLTRCAFCVAAEEDGARLDVYLALHCVGLSRSHARRLIEHGLATVNGQPAKPSHLLRAGDDVAVRIPPPVALDLAPESIPLSIVYEDKDLLVVNKPAGITVHPAAGRTSHTLVNALLAHCTDLAGVGGVLRPGIVHRLDKDTSGLLIVAKNDLAHAGLSRQLKERTVEKKYLALVHGRLDPAEAVIDAPIGRDPHNRKRMAVVDQGRAATTGYRVRESLGGLTLVEITPSTGRTHQIRVHLAAIGHPVVGDAVYGKPSPLVARQFLHACRLAFRHPADGRWLTFESPLPPDLERALQRARSLA